MQIRRREFKTEKLDDLARSVSGLLAGVEPIDIVSGVVKAAPFGAIIATVGCYMGLHTRLGAEGVGKATTVAVVSSGLLILVANYFLTAIFYLVI